PAQHRGASRPRRLEADRQPGPPLRHPEHPLRHTATGLICAWRPLLITRLDGVTRSLTPLSAAPQLACGGATRCEERIVAAPNTYNRNSYNHNSNRRGNYMKSHECGAWSALCALVIGTLCPAAAPAQTSDVKDK